MKTTLHIQILGKFSVANGDQITTRLRTRKTELLLAYLATRKGKPARREELAELFWPDEEESTARHKLRLALTSIRAAVGDHLTSDRLVVGLNDASLDADDLIQTNCAGLTPETETQVLPGYESFWINEVQAAIDSAIDQRIREGAAGAIDTENSASARLWLALNAKHHSLSKSVKQELISLLDRSGDKRGVQLFAPAKQAPPKSGRFVDVPEPRGILFGREQELIHLCEMLLGDNEPVLVTLQALSGVGKTRLSQELCKLAAIDEFEVVWISLDGIEDADRARSLTLQKLVDTQDIQELRSLPPTLLVLDNVEQLPQDAWRSTLDELLAHGDSLRIVQTSH
ncbi:MAG TPA: hypothetical protein VK171_14720, partial [Fimbriimonas sp.]|nr:hypothetical protein [Fimbriimonas sp.]